MFLSRAVRLHAIRPSRHLFSAATQRVENLVVKEKKANHRCAISYDEFQGLVNRENIQLKDGDELAHKMQQDGKVFRWQQPGFDHLVIDTDKVITTLGKVMTPKAVENQLQGLQDQLEAVVAATRPLQERKVSMEAASAKFANRMLGVATGWLAVQAAILFRMVFFTFDWNLMEPVTYFIGYSVMLGGLGWYTVKRSEHGYGSMHSALYTWHFNRHGFDQEALDKLLQQRQYLELQISKLLSTADTEKISLGMGQAQQKLEGSKAHLLQ